MAITAVTLATSAAVSTTVTTGVLMTMGAVGMIGTTVGVLAVSSAISLAVGGIVGQAIGAPINAALGLGPAAPSAVAAQQARGMLINAASSIDPLRVIYGSRRIGGTYVIPPFASDGVSTAATVSGGGLFWGGLALAPVAKPNEYLHLVIALAEGEIGAVNTIYLDDTPITNARFAGLVTAETFLGSDNQPASAGLLAGNKNWTASHQGKGVAYIHLQLKADPNAFVGLPVVTCDIDGKKVYDPRSGLTQFSNNPALCIRDYLTSTRYGRGIPAVLLDDSSIILAANYCDEIVSIPGGTQKRYTLDGAVNVDETVYANIQRMLSACRGMLIFSGGKYRLVIDKQEIPSAFTFNEDNITGAWEITRPGKRDKVNKVTASFFNPANNWQPDLSIQDSASYRTQDNGLLLERKIDLPYTANLYRASHLAQLEMKSTRFSTMVKFSAFQEGLRCEVGDVVNITHATPGWTNKPFRILSIDILDVDNVSIIAREYDDSAYTLDALSAVATAPQATLPDPFSASPPANLAADEVLYETRSGAGVKAKALITCIGSDDIFVREYQLEYKLTNAPSWTVLPAQASTSWEVNDIAPGIYDWRVRGISTFGARSNYITLRKEIFGLLARPANLSGLVVQSVSALDVLSWAQSPDLDVRIGGKVLVRHSPSLVGANWESSTTACSPLPGASTNVVLPLRAGTYFIKAEDSSGLQSMTAAAFISNGSALFTYTTLGIVQEDPTFSGSFTNTYHDNDVGSVIELVGTGNIDDALDFDAIMNVDYYGGVTPAGYYDFNAGLDLGVVGKARLTATISATADNVLDNIDSRIDSIDNWLDFDGTSGAPVDAWVELRSTNDNPAATPIWSDWQRLTSADLSARAFQFRAYLVSADPIYNIAINQLRIKAEAL